MYCCVLAIITVVLICTFMYIRTRVLATTVIVNQEHQALLVDGSFEKVSLTCRDACVTVVTDNNLGSGFFVSVDDQLCVITAAHVVENETYISVVASNFNGIQGNNQNLDCSLVGVDSAADIAVLILADGISSDNQKFLEFYSGITEVPQGSACAIIGNPQGSDVSSIASGLVRDGKYIESGVEGVYTTVPVLPGNSGAPILSVGTEPKVIGMCCWLLVDDEGDYQSCFSGGTNTFILVDSVKKILATKGNFTNKGYIGIRRAEPASYGSGPNGVRVLEADSGTFLVGDIILSVNGQAVGVFDNQYSICRHVWFAEGKTVSVKYTSGGNEQTKMVTVSTMPTELDNFYYTGAKYKRPVVLRDHSSRF